MVGGYHSGSAGKGALWRLLAVSLLAAFVFSLTAWGGASACPTAAKSHHAAVHHKLRSNDAIGKHVLMAAAQAAVIPTDPTGHCRGNSSSTADPSCKLGCCSAGAAIADLGREALVDVHLPAAYRVRAQDQLTPIWLPTHFRPPQIAA